jgi:hypothetical protein
MKKFSLTLLFSLFLVCSFLQAQQIIFLNDDFESGINKWTIRENDDDPWRTWILSGEQYRSPYNAAFHSGLSENNRAYLISPQLAFPAASKIKLSFSSLVHFPVEIGNSHVRIYTDTANIAGGSMNYTELWGPRTYNTDNQWQDITLDISSFAGQNVYVVFFYESTGFLAHTWYIDDVSVFALAHYDVGVAALNSPKTNVNLGLENVSVVLKNYGHDTVSNIPVSYILNGGAPVTETYSGSIVSESEAIFTFAEKINIASTDIYSLKIFTGLASEENFNNDTLKAEIRNYGSDTIRAFPFFEGFEDTIELELFWKQEYILNPNIARDTIMLPWYFTDGSLTIESRMIPHAHSGALNACYADWYIPMSAYPHHITKLISPVLDLSLLQAPLLKFWHAQRFWGPGCLDTLKVYYKTSGQAAWKLLYTADIPLEDWTQTILELPEKSSSYYIAFEGITNVGSSVVLDDIIVTEGEGIDARIMSIVAPAKTGVDMGMTEVKILLKNTGTQNISNINVGFKVDNVLVANEVITATLNTFEEMEYTFATRADMTAEDTFYLECFVAKLGDADNSNDTLSMTVRNLVHKAVMGLIDTVRTCDVDFYDDGVNDFYNIDYKVETQTITFYPEEAGKRIQVAFDTIRLSPFYVLSQIPIYGDSLFVYDGDSISAINRIGVLHDSMDNVTFTSSAANGALTFVFLKQSGESSPGWHAVVSCLEPPQKDAGVWRIAAPVKGGDNNSSVTVAIKNFGGNTLYGVDVAYNFDNGAIAKKVTEHCSDTLPAGEVTFYTFERPVNLSAYSENYKLTVFTQLSDDENTLNDTLQSKYFYREDIVLHGYRLWNAPASDYGAVSFTTNNPNIVTTENAYQDAGAGIIVAGAPTSDYIYAYTMDRISHTPKSFVKFDLNWNEVNKAAAIDVPADMAYDFVDNRMYGIKFDAELSASRLLQIDLNTGQMSEFSLQYIMSCIALDSNGNMYGISDNGYFCTIDKAMGWVFPVSHSGIWRTTLFQSMTVDYNTGRIFWVNGEEGTLFEINPVTGAFTNFGHVGGNAEVSCLFGSVPDKSAGIELSAVVEEDNLSVYPNPLSEGQALTVDGVAKAERMIIYDVQGRFVRVAAGTGEALRINGLRKGAYIVKAGDRVRRFIVH